MRVLWICNSLFPSICEKLGEKVPISGSWLYSLADKLAQCADIELAILIPYKTKKIIKIENGGIDFFLIPYIGDLTRYNQKNNLVCAQVRDIYQPDIVHIHGTEFACGLSYIRACGSRNIVVSIQGLVGIIERYYYAGMLMSDIIKNLTLRSIIFRDSIIDQRRSFFLRGRLEKKYFECAHNFIGRTEWDKTHAFTYNECINYFHCDELLRDSFYSGKWDIEKCNKYSIFLSQGNYPLKGLHQLLKALSIVKKTHPDVRLYIGGKNIIGRESLYEKLAFSNYGKYIFQLIKKNDLVDNVIFLGFLNEEEMKKCYLKSHVFVVPSSIENSPNSLAEAQILGLPLIAANVGGIPSMVKDGTSGYLYRFEEYETLAVLILRIFKGYDKSISMNSINVAKKRHDPAKIIADMLSIYKRIIIK